MPLRRVCQRGRFSVAHTNAPMRTVHSSSPCDLLEIAFGSNSCIMKIDKFVYRKEMPLGRILLTFVLFVCDAVLLLFITISALTGWQFSFFGSGTASVPAQYDTQSVPANSTASQTSKSASSANSAQAGQNKAKELADLLDQAKANEAGKTSGTKSSSAPKTSPQHIAQASQPKAKSQAQPQKSSNPQPKKSSASQSQKSSYATSQNKTKQAKTSSGIPNGNALSTSKHAGTSESEKYTWNNGWKNMSQSANRIKYFIAITVGWKAMIISDPLEF